MEEIVEVRIATTAVKRCMCKHEYQDKKYGGGKRLHNLCTNDSKSEGLWRCTVCGRRNR